jgi:hypothetical protein
MRPPVDEKVSAIAEKAHAGEAITEEEIKMLVDEAEKLESALRGRAKPEESAE